MIRREKISWGELCQGCWGKMKGCPWLLFLMLWGITAGGNEGMAQALAGNIVDPQAAAVAGARVGLYRRDSNARWSTLSDSQGQFRFDRVTPGSYFIEVEAQGFARMTTPPVFTDQKGIEGYRITLALAQVKQEVVVTAAGSAQSIDELAKTVTVLDQQEVTQRDEYSIASALRTVPGVRFQQLGGPGSLSSLKIRGQRNEDTSVLIDGQRFRDVAAPQGDASGFLSDLLFIDTERVEVLNGSGSSFYGTHAIGGVVNIITDEGGGRAHGNILLEGGSLGFFRGLAQVAGGIHNDRVTYSLGAGNLSVTRGVDGDDATRNTSGQGKLQFHLSPTSTLSARLYAVDGFQQINTSPFAAGEVPASGIVPAVPLSLDALNQFESGVPLDQIHFNGANFVPSINDPDFRRTAKFLVGSVIFSQQPRDGWNYSLAYQGLATDRTFFDGPGGVLFQPFTQTQSDYDGRTQNLTARTDVRLGSFNLLNVGYEFEQERYLNRNLTGIATEDSSVDVTQRSNTLYVQDLMRLWGDRLQIMLGFRYQGFTLLNPTFLPSVDSPYQGMVFAAPPSAYTGDGAIAYFIRSTGTKFRAHVGNGYRAPSLYERFGTYYSSFGYSAYGDPRLQPDRSIAVDGGLEQSFCNNRIRTSATYFYTRLQQVIIFDFSGGIDPGTDPFGRYGGYRNSGGGLARGVELSARFSPTRSTDVAATYTYTNAVQNQPIVAGVLKTFVIPDNMFSLVLTQHVGQRFYVNLNYVASSNYLAPLLDYSTFTNRAYQFGGYQLAELGSSYQFPIGDTQQLRFYFKIGNLFNQDYYEAGYRTPGLTGLVGVQFSF
ncbi:MAG: TonB-dependent receptor [Terriglobia bacterium]